MMTILGWILFGLVVGALAKLVMPGRDPGGIIITILIGIAGAVLGGFVGRALGLYAEGEPAGWFMAFLGSVLLLFIYRMMVGRRYITRP
jgi:uncharacterized membrane protein YeaQ/YmgE (transglycosylase-associated protein family)